MDLAADVAPSPSIASRRRDRQAEEGGYVIAMTALLLIPMMIFAALAVDVAGWTNQTTKIQNAADAASLAGSPLMPNRIEAEIVAREVATHNGFTDGVDGHSVDVDFPDDQTIRVTITDESDQYFASVVMEDPIDLTRFADATAISPVTLGSPTNVLGFGPFSLDTGHTPSGYWMLENNRCQHAHFGDYKGGEYLSAPYCGVNGATGPLNDRWKTQNGARGDGYMFVVEIPKDLTVSSTLMILDPGKCGGYGRKNADGRANAGGQSPTGGTQGTRLEFRRWDGNQTPLITSDDQPWSGAQGNFKEFTSADGPNICLNELSGTHPASAWTDKTTGWFESHFVFAGNTTGKTEYHYIQTSALPADRLGWNHYSFWVRPNDGVTTHCLTIGATNCPTIGAETWISANASGPGIGAPMELYLGEIGPEHEGKTMKVKLWDVGEGMDNIQIKDPLGNSLDFTWESDDTFNPGYAGPNPSDANCAPNPCLYLDPGFNGHTPKYGIGNMPGWNPSWIYNGRILTLNVDLDIANGVDYPFYANPASGNVNGYWFSLQFMPIPTKNATEWASFSLAVSGDPIRLTD